MFSSTLIRRLLNDVCAVQLGDYADLRVRFSFLCEDPLSIAQTLAPLVDNATQTDDLSGSWSIDVQAPGEALNVRVQLTAGAYHQC